MPICGKIETFPSFESLGILLEAAVLNQPKRKALIEVETNETITFLQLSERSNQFSRFLLKELHSSCQNGLLRNPDGDLVIAICIPPSIDLIVVIFAILKIRGAYLPLDVDFPASRVDYILNDAKPELLLTKGSPSATKHLQNGGVYKILQLENIYNQVKLEETGTLKHQEVDLFQSNELLTAILYTSGSTGLPKGVRVPQNATLNRLFWQWKVFPFCDNEVCCFKTVVTFVDSISEIFGPLLTGHSVVIIPKVMTTDIENLIEVLDRYKVNRIVLVPSLLRSLLLSCSRQQNTQLQFLRLWICSGEVCSSELLKWFFDVFSNGKSICNFYGSTEVLADVTYIKFKSLNDLLTKLLNNKVPIGMPIYNCRIYLMNEGLETEVTDGNIGEICVAGNSLASGYVGKEQSDRFIKNPLSATEHDLWYRTGDFGLYSGGQIHYAGRMDSQMKVRGHRIDLSEIEMAIQSLDFIEKCHALSFRPGEVDQALLCFFTTRGETKKELQAELPSLLPSYMWPQCIKIEELPLLVNGKVDRQTLLDNYEMKMIKRSKNLKFDDLGSCDAEKKEFAIALLKVVARVLGASVPPVLTLEQNFFDIGGNSLNAVLVITTLQDAGFYIGISDFLKAKHFGEVLLHLSKIKDKSLKICNLKCTNMDKYKCLPLSDSMKNQAITMIAKSFSEKGDLETFANVTYEEFYFTTFQMWPTLLDQDLSFVVCHYETEDIVAVSLNDDLRMLAPLHFKSEKIQHVFDFLGFCEEAASLELPKDSGKVLHSEMMATSTNISPSENVALIQFMEEENINLAKRKGFHAIFTTNTSSITQHICEDLFCYKPLKTAKLNQYVAKDGTMPFEKAPEGLFATTSIYYVQT